MNRARLVTAVGIGLLAVAGGLRAATLAVDSQDVTALKPKIDQFLTTQIAAVSGTDFVAAKNAREAIIAEVTSTIPTAPKPSGVFTDLYSETLAYNLNALLQSPDVRIRLNAAIIIAKVAERVNNARLAPLCLKLLSDPSTAVLQWGVHACQYVLPPLMVNPQQAQQLGLLPAMVKAVNAHNTDGSLVEAAYNALAMSGNAAIPQVVAAVQEILDKRIALYQKNIPPMPAVDQLALVFLVSRPVWNATGANQAAMQHKTMDLMCQLITSAAQRGPAAGINDRNELVDLMRKSASGFQVVGGYLNNNDLITAGKKLATVNAGATGDYKALTDGMVQAIGVVPQFSGIGGVAPLPASMPTTSEITTTP